MMISLSSVLVNCLQCSLTPVRAGEGPVFGFWARRCKMRPHIEPQERRSGGGRYLNTPRNRTHETLFGHVGLSGGPRHSVGQGKEVHLIGRGVAEALVKAPCVVEH